MKTKEYIKKYKLNIDDKFSHNEFVEDLTYEFISLLEVGKATENIKGFENATRAIRMKWDAINNKTVGQLSEKLWNFFWATVIVKTKEQLFPKEIARQKEIREAKKHEWEERRKWEDQEFNSFFDWGFLSFLKSAQIPRVSLQLLNLDDSKKPTKEELNSAYKKLALKHHPDKGGKQEDFIMITEAKNKVQTWIT